MLFHSPSDFAAASALLDFVPHNNLSMASSFAFFRSLLAATSSSSRVLASTCYKDEKVFEKHSVRL